MMTVMMMRVGSRAVGFSRKQNNKENLSPLLAKTEPKTTLAD